jgi:hypothetical protein
VVRPGLFYEAALSEAIIGLLSAALLVGLSEVLARYLERSGDAAVMDDVREHAS